MKEKIQELLMAVDRFIGEKFPECKLPLYHIGRSSLVWKYGFTSTTGDIDVILPDDKFSTVTESLKLEFGRDTAESKRMGLYLETVNSALPPCPRGYKNRAVRADEPFKSLELYHLEPHDFIVTKLKRFYPRDREDIQQMCEKLDIDPATLEQRLESAFFYSLPKDGDRDRDTAFANLAKVQKFLNGDTTEL